MARPLLTMIIASLMLNVAVAERAAIKRYGSDSTLLTCSLTEEAKVRLLVKVSYQQGTRNQHKAADSLRVFSLDNSDASRRYKLTEGHGYIEDLGAGNFTVRPENCTNCKVELIASSCEAGSGSLTTLSGATVMPEHFMNGLRKPEETNSSKGFRVVRIPL